MHATSSSRARKHLAPSKKARKPSTAEASQPKLSITAYASISEPPPSSAHPSAYPAAEEDNLLQANNRPSFPFLSLPAELRNKIYPLAFAVAPPVIDLDPHTFGTLQRHKVLALFRVSRQVHREAAHYFFSTHTFRLFPTFPGRYFKTKRPLLARLPTHYRASITSLELRLGPGWNNPPQGWVVNDALGLVDCVNVRVLKVFVECDPSDAIFKGFRMGEGAYERFSAGLLDGVLKAVPEIKVVEFDAYSSVKRTGDMMSGLERVAKKSGKIIGWGPERGWQQESDQAWLDAVLIHGAGKRLNKSVVIFG